MKSLEDKCYYLCSLLGSFGLGLCVHYLLPSPSDSVRLSFVMVNASAAFTLMGFSITAVAVYIGMIGRPLLKKMLQDGRYNLLLQNFKVTIICLSVCFAVSIISIVVGIPLSLNVVFISMSMLCLFLAIHRLFKTMKYLS